MAKNGILKILGVVTFAFLAIYVLQLSSSKHNNQELFHSPNNENMRENMENQCGSSCSYQPPYSQEDIQNAVGMEPPTCPQSLPNECEQDNMYQDPAYQQLRQASCFPRSQLSPEELLPQDNCSLWAQVNPQGTGSLKDRNFLQAGWATGVSTVGSTLRNANRQLRSEPPNPQVKVSPWMQSTVEPDVSRKPFEIGGCA